MLTELLRALLRNRCNRFLPYRFQIFRLQSCFCTLGTSTRATVELIQFSFICISHFFAQMYFRRTWSFQIKELFHNGINISHAITYVAPLPFSMCFLCLLFNTVMYCIRALLENVANSCISLS